MKIKFQIKLLFAFISVIGIIIIPLLYLVNAKISAVSEANIEKNLQVSQRVFKKNEEFKRQAASSSAASLLASQASIRAILGSAPSGGSDLFGDAPSASLSPDVLKNTNDVLFSSIESFDLYQNNPIFLFTDAKGTLLLTKTEPHLAGPDLSQIPVIRDAMKGETAISFWGNRDPSLKNFSVLPSSGPEPVLYEVFAKPLVFGDSSVKGLMVVGFAIQKQDLDDMKAISQSEVAFVSKGVVYGSSLAVKTNLNDLLTRPGLSHFVDDGEEFIALVSKLKDSDATSQTASIVFKSKTKELLFYTDLKNALNLIGILAGLVAAGIALLLSTEVSKAVRALMKGAKEVGEGNLNYTVQIKTRDEFSDLGEAFNKMTAGLREKESIKKTFKRYVSPKVVNSLLEDESKLKLGGDKRELVIFFSDIAGFTAISEALSPESTIDFLNQYLAEMAKIVEDNEGVVDKFIGDAIMAYWIDPASRKKNSILACSVSLEQQKMILRLREKWRDNPVLKDVGARIGIHSGEVIIGNIGSEERMDYTIIGDNVNTASRLESINKYYHTSTVISEAVASDVKENFTLRELDLIKVVGKSKPIRIYELVGYRAQTSSDKLTMIDEFTLALASFQAGKFSEAQRGFSELSRQFPDDGPTRLYLERSQSLVKNPPEKWDGVYEAKAK